MQYFYLHHPFLFELRHHNKDTFNDFKTFKEIYNSKKVISPPNIFIVI